MCYLYHPFSFKQPAGKTEADDAEKCSTGDWGQGMTGELSCGDINESASGGCVADLAIVIPTPRDNRTVRC